MMRNLLRLTILSLITTMAPDSLWSQQQATVQGDATDPSEAVLPGVTVTATETSTGRQYVTVTDSTGAYRLPTVQPGTYTITAELPGFSRISVPDVELLVGQNLTLPFELSLASVAEQVTVTAEAPLIDLTSSENSGNVDRRQMEELPILGRNWMELSMQVKGVYANDTSQRPGVAREDRFQLTLDGQEVTQKVSGSDRGQPKYSREAIAEFQIVTNNFDITQGRSTGVQVKAITRSGTNEPHGSFFANFRDDAFNAADPVVGEVLPYETQQIGGSFGGPIKRDRTHFFVAYEYEREPNTIFSAPVRLPNQTFSFPTKRTENSLLGRVDHDFSADDHLSVRLSYYDFDNPFELGGTTHPSAANYRTRQAGSVFGTWSKVLSDRMVQEVKFGYNHFEWDIGNVYADFARLVFPGLAVGPQRNYPQKFWQNQWTGRYELNVHRTAHDFKFGGEFVYWRDEGIRELVSRGEYIFTALPNNLEQRFPADAYDDPSQWDLTGLDDITLRYDKNAGDWTVNIPRPTWAIWFGDNWQVSESLMINYGLRWDVDWGALAPTECGERCTNATFNPQGGVAYNMPPFPADSIPINAGDRIFRSDLRDLNNIAPRVGFTFDVGANGDLVIRGGTGKFFGVPISNVTYSQQSFNLERVIASSFPNDGLPGFVEDPTRGITDEDILSGAVPLPPQTIRPLAHNYEMPYSWQSSIGFQKQLNADMAVEADFLYWKEQNLDRPIDLNLFYNPETGYNTNLATTGRPDPAYGQVQYITADGEADYAGIAMGFRRRFTDNWQLNATYNFMFFKNDSAQGNYSFFTFPNNSFDWDDEWARSNDFQRNTIRLSGIYRFPYDINVSAAYFFGSGNWFAATVAGVPFGKPGPNRLNTGAPLAIPSDLLDRWNGPATIGTNETVPRNGLEGDNLSKVDVRVSKDIRFGENLRVVLIGEIFNLFNHKNYGAYVTQVNSPSFGDPVATFGSMYVPRSGQLGLRITF
jgi:hypothetical protein